MTKTQIKPQYLTPKVSVVTFMVEGGYSGSQTPAPINDDMIQTNKASEYTSFQINWSEN